MTESEWQAGTELIPMLIHLRSDAGSVPRGPDYRPRLITNHGDLLAGSGERVGPGRLARFAAACLDYWDWPLDGPSRRLLRGYGRFLRGDATWEEFLADREQAADEAASCERPLLLPLACWWDLTPTE